MLICSIADYSRPTAAIYRYHSHTKKFARPKSSSCEKNCICEYSICFRNIIIYQTENLFIRFGRRARTRLCVKPASQPASQQHFLFLLFISILEESDLVNFATIQYWMPQQTNNIWIHYTATLSEDTHNTGNRRPFESGVRNVTPLRGSVVRPASEPPGYL